MFWCPKVTPVKSILFQLCNFNKFRTHVYQMINVDSFSVKMATHHFN